MVATSAVLAAAAGVGFGHAVLPDHWAPLAVVARAQRYPLRRVAQVSGLAGLAHVVVSVALGVVIVAIGLQFRSSIESVQDEIVGSLLIATGVGFALLELLGKGPGHPHSQAHSDHTHREAPAHFSHRKPLGVIVPFGAAASPDLTILPVFLAASTAGAATAIGSLVVFAGVTMITIVGLTVFATVAAGQVRARWLDRWGNLVTAGVLVLIGIVVLLGVV